MIYEKIDLYDYFSLKRPENAAGILTVYCREKTGDLLEKLRPAMLVLPGGGYAYCSDREQEPVALRYLHAGFSAFVLRYTVNTAYPVPLIEAAMAMCFIRENAQKYSVDPAHVAAIGFSAGAHLAGMLATMYGEAPVKEALAERLVRPDAVLLTYPVISGGKYGEEGTMSRISGGDPALRETLSLEKRVTSSCPPAFLWHTVEDDCAPVENSLLFAAACKKAGVPFEMHLFEKGRHGTSVANIEVEESEEQVQKISHLAVWFDLSLVWLDGHGFAVKTK